MFHLLYSFSFPFACWFEVSVVVANVFKNLKGIVWQSIYVFIMHDGKIHTFKGNIAETTRKSTGTLNF